MYGDVPPDGVTVVLPFDPPLHATLVVDAVEASAVGCVIVNVRDAEQLLASVTVTVYDPAASPVLEEVNPPFDHW